MVIVSEMRKLIVFIIGLALPLIAGDSSRQTMTNTERISVTTPGTIRFENSFGEIDIEGWDQPEIEVTTTKWTEDVHTKERARAERRLESVRITTKRDGNDVIISTVGPARNRFIHPSSWWSDVAVTYRINAPRGSRLVVDRNNAGVSITGMTGDIRVMGTSGQITLMLADGPYAIDAMCSIGSVYSDFEGTSQRRHVLGETFRSEREQLARNIYLRMRFGDIVILKMPAPPSG
jgi:hypothetical protein